MTIPVIVRWCFEDDLADAIGTEVTDVVGTRGIGSRSGLGSVDVAEVFAQREATVAAGALAVH
jgi:hypothetical protein